MPIKTEGLTNIELSRMVIDDLAAAAPQKKPNDLVLARRLCVVYAYIRRWREKGDVSRTMLRSLRDSYPHLEIWTRLAAEDFASGLKGRPDLAGEMIEQLREAVRQWRGARTTLAALGQWLGVHKQTLVNWRAHGIPAVPLMAMRQKAPDLAIWKEVDAWLYGPRGDTDSGKEES